MQNLLQLVPVLREVMKLVAEVSVFVELKFLLWSGWLRLATLEQSRLVVTGFELLPLRCSALSVLQAD